MCEHVCVCVCVRYGGMRGPLPPMVRGPPRGPPPRGRYPSPLHGPDGSPWSPGKPYYPSATGPPGGPRHPTPNLYKDDPAWSRYCNVYCKIKIMWDDLQHMSNNN